MYTRLYMYAYRSLKTRRYRFHMAQESQAKKVG